MADFNLLDLGFFVIKDFRGGFGVAFARLGFFGAI